MRLTVDRNGMLQETEIHFEIMQEYSSGARGERIILGNIKLKLAEYVDGSDDVGDGVCRRYLMQESRINSTLKVGIRPLGRLASMLISGQGVNPDEADGRRPELHGVSPLPLGITSLLNLPALSSRLHLSLEV